MTTVVYSTSQLENTTKVKPKLATPFATLVLAAAICFSITNLVGVWSAYEASGTLLHFGLFSVGVSVMFGIGWRSCHHPKTTLSLVGLGCSLLAAVIGVAYLLSFTTNSGMVASSLIVLLPLGAMSIIWNQRQRQQTAVQLGLTAMGIAGVAFVLCFERTAWISLVAGLLGAAYVHWRFGAKRNIPSSLYQLSDVIVVLGIGLGLFVYWQLLTNPHLDGWFKATPLGGALWKRVPLWRESLALIQDYYFTGSGLGETAMVYSTYVYLLHVPFLYHAHNLYLQIAVEQGMPGLIAFLWLALPLLGSLIVTYQRTGPYSRLFCLATITALVAALFYGLLDSELYATLALPILFVPFGYALALHWSLLHRKPTKSWTEFENSADHAWGLHQLGIAVLPVVSMVVVCLHPGFSTTWQVNLGTVAQTKAELGEYDWPRWPIQDELRRSSRINLSEAMHDYKAVLAEDPNNITAHARLGQIALSRGDYTAATQHLEIAYRFAPQRNAVRQLLGEVYAATGQIEEAAALWHTVDTGAGQLDDRLWWYTHLNAQREVNWIQQAIALAH
ncbi:MAG: O-antigen ligase family protein [Caldilineaceae bacterium]